MDHVETDPDSGAEIYRLVDDPRPADNIYGEQPYSSSDGEHVAVRFHDGDGRDGGLSVLDLTDGSLRTVLESEPRFPAFHAWGDYLYFQESVDGRIVLRRCHFGTAETERVTTLPEIEGRYSYGTVSGDHRYYAVSVRGDDRWSVLLVDLERGTHRVLIERADYLFKHEQFARDGTNRLLVQANKQPDVEQVHLGILHPEQERGDIDWLAADQPHTPRPTGHEAWVGETDRVLFSTGAADEHGGNLWVVGVDDDEPRLVSETAPRCGHVSVSADGRYWIGDATGSDSVPIHAGSIETGDHRRLVHSRTAHDGTQQSHTHPYLTADNRWLIFTSTRAGHPQVFGARLPPDVFERLS